MKKNRTRKNRLLAIFIIGLICVTTFAAIGCGKSTEDTKDKKVIESVDDIEGTRIGVQSGTTGAIYAEDYEGDEAGTIVERYNKGADAIQSLKLNKIDCVIIDELPALEYVARNPELAILDEEFTLEEYAMCIDKSSTALKLQINDALKELRDNGIYDQIVDYYINNEDGSVEKYVPKDVSRDNGTLIVATNAAFPPYEFYSEGKVTGLDMDLSQAVCDILGMKLQIEDMEFDSIIVAVTSGKADVGVAGMTVTEDRLKNIDFTDSYTTSKQVIVVNTGSTQDIETLSFVEKFKQNFIDDNRYEYLLTGFRNTIIITIGAVIIGIILGFLIAMVRTTHDRIGGLTIINAICRVYVTIIRGTPAMVQLLIMFYIILAAVNNKIVVAVIAFGLNSAAYVSEIVRSGIMAVDPGQMEAGQSLGMTYNMTMIRVILPQAVKNILPALCNELISLIKETSISGYIGLIDLTKGADIIRSNTYEATMPLLAIALIYLAIVMILTGFVHKLEKRLRNNER
ncbi:MAG: ABC transporter substrate-binding protein/permease [Clostridiales bacterium]|nr:ABC transporter substrate-binding protein/permease [Clostridiales bacterium]